MGRRACRPQKSPVLTPAMRAKRVEWARRYAHWTVNDWKKVIFSDETTIEVQPIDSRYVCQSISEPLKAEHYDCRFCHPIKVMIWGCISLYGTGRIHVVENTMKKEQYHHVLESCLLPQARDWFGNHPWIFQHDHAPVRMAKSCTDFLR